MRSEHSATTTSSPLGGLGERLEEAALEATTTIRLLQDALAGQRRRVEALEARAADLEHQVAVADARLAVETMHAAGLAAQASHLMAVAVEAGLPAMADLMEEGTEDRPRSRLAGIYDLAFDAKAAELGIEDPTRFREG